MSWELTLTLLLGAVIVLMLLGLPVVFAFLAVNVVGAWLVLGGSAGMELLVRNALDSVTSYTLVPIPLFIFMGELLFHSGLAMRAIDSIDRLIVRVPGRLAVVAIVAGTIFSAISGSTVATTMMLGSLLLPEMLKRGYSPRLAMGAIMGIGGVDALIPPSALTVLFASLAVIPVAPLLIGGVVPGLILSAAFVGYIVLASYFKWEKTPDEAPVRLTPRERWIPLFRDVMPLVLIFVVVVVSMARGWAAPTEAAGVGATATLAVAALYRSLTRKGFIAALRGTAIATGAILFIIMGASTYSQILNFSGATSGLIVSITSGGGDPLIILIVMLVILIFLGFFLDEVSTMLMTLPFYMPLVQQLGFDKTWFGVLYMMCMQLGLLTPPFGILLFAMRSVAPKEISTRDIFRAANPFMLLGLIALIAVFLWPALATWLPKLLD
ncbi:MAG: TRAP transporter large permease [Anaerolineae bacterium]|nr:TRAP transporter large permease [Phycisphaerae bacterium]